MPDASSSQAAGAAARILIVCARWEEARQIRSFIGPLYPITVVSDGRQASEHLGTGAFDAVVFDDSPGSPDPVEVLNAPNAMTANVPAMVMTANPEISTNHVDRKRRFRTLTKPVSRQAFLSAFADVLDRISEAQSRALTPILREVMTIARPTLRRFLCTGEDDAGAYRGIQEVADMVATAADDECLDDLLRLLRRHHDYTFAHSLRVGTLLAAFGKEVGFHRDDLKLASLSGLVHDVGKRNVPLDILDKPDGLDPAELTVMRRHATWSGEILRTIGGVPEEAIQVGERHHEKVDGSGYPNGLAGHQMGDLTLLSAIVDVFVALTDQRAYKPGLPVGETLSLMGAMAGTHLDRPLFERFGAMVLEHNL